MSRRTYLINNPMVFDLIKSDLNSQILLAVSGIANNSMFEISSFKDIFAWAKEQKIEVILLADKLVLESDFKNYIDKILEVLNTGNISTIRVNDLGVGRFFKNNYSKIGLELILGPMGPNIKNYQALIQEFLPTIKKVIFPLDLSKQKIFAYINEISVKKEIFVYGPILLMKSRRNFFEKKDQFVTLVPKEGCNHAVRGISKKDQSLLYHSRIFSILDILDEEFFKKERVDTLVDLSFFASTQNGINGWQDLKNALIKDKTYEITTGMYHGNKTNVMFKKLKRHISDKSIGEVISTIKDRGHLIELFDHRKKEIIVGQEITFLRPDKKEMVIKVKSLMDIEGESLLSSHLKKYVILGFCGGITAKTQLL